VVQVWAELGIEPTREAAAIRRAYAARLKQVRPDKEPDAFARLREAYERALSMAAAPPARAPHPPPAPQPKMPAPPPEPQDRPEPPRPNPSPARPGPAFPPKPLALDPGPVRPTSTVVTPEPPRAAEVEPVTALLRRGEVVAAAEWLAQARRDLRLRLADDLRLADQIGWAMARDMNLPAAAVRDAAARLGWDRQADGAWAQPLRTRLQAEAWLEALRRSACSPKRWLGGRAAADHMMLAQKRLPAAYWIYRNLWLQRRYREYLLHSPIVGDQFDSERMDAIGKAMTWRPKRWVVWLTTVLITIFFPIGLGLRAGEFDPGLQTPVTVVAAVLTWGFATYLFVKWLRIRVQRRRDSVS
jgi:hypothetical protein